MCECVSVCVCESQYVCQCMSACMCERVFVCVSLCVCVCVCVRVRVCHVCVLYVSTVDTSSKCPTLSPVVGCD